MMQKRFELRDEPIVDPDIPIVDCHHHLIDRHGVTYLREDMLQDVNAGHNVIATVYVESRAFVRPDGPEFLRPLGELEFANGVAAMCANGDYGPCRMNAGIVAFADLAAGSGVAETLERQIAMAPERFKGIRQTTMWSPREEPYKFISIRPERGIIASQKFREGFAELAKRDLTFDTAIFHTQLPEVIDLARDFPDATIVLNHLGFADGMGLDEAGRQDVFVEWRKLLTELAAHENVVCKVSGLAMPFWGFGFHERADPVSSAELAETWKPYVDTAIELFGTKRCMMASNFPADGHSCGYVPLWNALKTIVKSHSADERTDLFRGTASRVYSLELN